MKKISIFLWFLFIIFMQCAVPKVTYDYDRGVDFSKYKTFNFKTINLKNISELEMQHIVHAVKSQMKAKGFKWSDMPDISLSIMPIIQIRKKQTGNFSIGLGKWDRNIGINLNSSVPIINKVQDTYLEIEILEVRSNHLIWNGAFNYSAKATRNSYEKERLINQYINQLLVNFPPK